MKWAHVLRKNHINQLPSRFIFVDTETLPTPVNEKLDIHKLNLGVACTVRTRKNQPQTEKWITFEDPKVFWDFVEEQIHEKEKFYLYAHNIHFDFFALQGTKWLSENGWTLKNWFIKSNVFIMNFKKGSKKLCVLDSGNILKAKLSSIAKTLGMEKLEIDFATKDRAALETYCKRDVEILKEWILRYVEFLRSHDLGNFKPTIASQSFQAFRHRFMDNEIFIHANEKAYELERESYHGGRTECFYIGKKDDEKLYLLDVNSMYPFVMSSYEYPARLLRYGKDCGLPFLEWALTKYCVIAKVFITVTENCVGHFQDKLIFPVGSFETVLTSEELKYVLKHHKVHYVKEFALYEKKPFARNYIKFFYDLKSRYKSEGKPLDYMITKLFLNSLYGKFGQKSQQVKRIGECDPDLFGSETVIDAETDELTNEVYMFGSIFQLSDYHESFDSFPAIASHITANARLYLWRLFKTAGLENVYYCDTDSILVNTTGFNKLSHMIDKERLGALSLEKEMDWVVIHGCKDYDFQGKIKRKGIKDNAVQLYENTFVQDHFLKFRGMMLRGITEGAAVLKIQKQLKRSYDKGIILPNGRVVPHSFTDSPSSA